MVRAQGFGNAEATYLEITGTRYWNTNSLRTHERLSIALKSHGFEIIGLSWGPFNLGWNLRRSQHFRLVPIQNGCASCARVRLNPLSLYMASQNIFPTCIYLLFMLAIFNKHPSTLECRRWSWRTPRQLCALTCQHLSEQAHEKQANICHQTYWRSASRVHWSQIWSTVHVTRTRPPRSGSLDQSST